MSLASNRVAGVAVAALVFAADQALKAYLLGDERITERLVEIAPIFRLNYSENYGVSLGLLPAGSPATRWALVALTGAIALGVLVWLLRERRGGDVLALGLVLGGALGNIADRVTRGFVIDYADLHFGDVRPFLIFNLADAAITIGVVVLLARALLVREKPAAARLTES